MVNILQLFGETNDAAAAAVVGNTELEKNISYGKSTGCVKLTVR